MKRHYFYFQILLIFLRNFIYFYYYFSFFDSNKKTFSWIEINYLLRVSSEYDCGSDLLDLCC